MKDSMNSTVIELTGGDDIVIVPMPEVSSTAKDTSERVWEVRNEDRAISGEGEEPSAVISEADQSGFRPACCLRSDPSGRRELRKAISIKKN